MKSALSHPAFREGVREFLTVTPGLFAWGLMTGVATIKSGLSVFEAALMSTLVFAGSAQLAVLPLLVASAPIWVVLATTFCVNLRFIVFSAHLRGFVVHRPTGERLFLGYMMADLGYVFFTRRHPEPATDDAGREEQRAYWLGLGVTAWLVWNGSCVAGMVLGNAVPESWGLGFAGTLALLAILASLVGDRHRALAALVAGVAAVLAYALPLKLGIMVAILASVAICMALERMLGVEDAR